MGTGPQGRPEQIVKETVKTIKMVFSDEDKVLIKNVYLLKNYGPAKLMSEFPEKKLEEAWIGEPPEKATGNRDD